MFFLPHESTERVILASTLVETKIECEENNLTAGAVARGFFLIYAASEEESIRKLEEARSNYEQWLVARSSRIKRTSEKYSVNSESPYFK